LVKRKIESNISWIESLSLCSGGKCWTDERIFFDAVIGCSNVVVKGTCNDSSVQQVLCSHIVGGRSVHLDVVPVQRKQFSLPVKLHRGGNRLVCEPFDDSGRSFSLKVTYKTGIREWIETVIFSIIFALVIKTFIVQPFYIPSESMEHTLKVGDRIMVNRFDYLLHNPSRTDVMVFEDPRQLDSSVLPRNSLYFIKRIIGLPGEKVEIIERKVYIDGNPLSEDYINLNPEADDTGLPTLETYRSLPVIEDEEFFVMGDNRDNSTDSRVWGCVPDDKVVGKAAFIWYPFSRMSWFH